MKKTIEVPEGYDLEKTEEGWKLVKVDQEKKWEDFGEVEGYFINDWSEVGHIDSALSENSNMNTFPTEQEANAYGVVLPQLLQWRNKVNGDWKADWSDSKQVKYCIILRCYKIVVDGVYWNYYPLSFQTKEIAEQFLKDHKSLIEQLIIK